jgi:DNA-binding cell septation regulator SpoVG
MKVTQVQLSLLNEPKLKATADIVLDECLKIKGIKAIARSEGLFLDFPSQKRKIRCHYCKRSNPCTARYCSDCGVAQHVPPLSPHGSKESFHIVYPIAQSLRNAITEAVLGEYYYELYRS